MISSDFSDPFDIYQVKNIGCFCPGVGLITTVKDMSGGAFFSRFDEFNKETVERICPVVAVPASLAVRSAL